MTNASKDPVEFQAMCVVDKCLLRMDDMHQCQDCGQWVCDSHSQNDDSICDLCAEKRGELK